MKLTRHNGRSGKHGTYNPRHNDRRFDVENSEHIDAQRAKKNVYLSFNYQHSWGIHNLKAMVGAEYQKDIRTGFWTSAKGITNNDMYYQNPIKRG